MKSFINFNEIIRSFRRNIETGILSILGLTVGITVALLIGFWSLNEFSYDKFHKNYEVKYRLCRKGFLNNESILLGSECIPAGKDASERFPEIKSFVRLAPMGRQIVSVENEKYFIEDVVATDQNFFNFFSFPLLIGNPDQCIESTDNIVINEKLAQTWFPDKNPIGQTIGLFGKKWTISAIVQNVPANTHINYQIIAPLSGIERFNNAKWGEQDFIMTYFELKPGTDIIKLSRNINKMAIEASPLYKQFQIEHFMQRLDDIHFSTGFRFDNARMMDKRIIFIFITIALLILLIACFNFINLFISTAFLRSKSIGIRKIVGSSKLQLYISSFAEISIYVIIATLIAVVLAYSLLPVFNQITDTTITFSFKNPGIPIFICTLLLTTTLIAGIIPMIYITHQNPEVIIRQKLKGKNISVLQRALVIAQFTASIILISSSLVIKKQIQFIRTKDLGFNKENMIYMNPRGKFATDYEMVRQELMKMPGIVEVTSKSCLPSDWHNGNPVTTKDNPDSKWIMEVCEIKENYLGQLGIPLVKGEITWDASLNDSFDCLINEQAMKALGYKDPIGEQIGLYQQDKKFTIRGVLKDANTKSLHRIADPQIFIKLAQVREYHVMLIKVSDSHQAIQSLQQLWTKLNPDIPFEYHFLDQVYENLYKVERTANQVVTIGMFIAIFLAFMGLFAIAHYATLRRIKEVGVRKVNGAKTGEIIALLNRDFIVWVIIAFAVATPVSYYTMMKWLGNFAYKTSLSWWIFFISGGLALGIAMLTVSWQSWKAASRNPVKALRYE